MCLVGQNKRVTAEIGIFDQGNASEPRGNEPRCSFCGRTRLHVKTLIAGANAVYICNECIDLCVEVLAEQDDRPS
jgi:hypothetical protein